MNWFEKFIYRIEYKTAQPQMYGYFHICALLIMFALIALVIVCRKKISRKFINNTLLIVGIVLLLSEVGKQIINSFNVVNGVAVWGYEWKTFPFQFCSVPMYLILLAGILRKGKVYDVLLCFLATFSLFGGLSVMFYPSNVFSTILFKSVHTMLWHGTMVVVSFMLLATKSVEFKFKTVWKACIIFIICVVIAVIINIIWHFYGTEETFNMFYISPYYECELPLVVDIQRAIPYVFFLMIYVVGFIGIACLIMAMAIGVDKLSQLISGKGNHKSKRKHLKKLNLQRKQQN